MSVVASIPQQAVRAAIIVACLALGTFVACAPKPTPVPVSVVTPPTINTPKAVIVADAPATGTPHPTATAGSPSSIQSETAAMPRETSSPTSTLTPTPAAPPSFLQQQIANLFDLTRLPEMQNSLVTQFTSRNWASLEYFFDYFIDDGNFIGENYGYVNEAGERLPYQIVTGYDGSPEYQVVPRVQGPGAIVRIWFAYQQHESLNNPEDMSRDDEWSNWGNLRAMGNVRFYFDDEPTPRLDLGIKELFVGKNPFPAPLAAFYASANGGNINYVPIPFERSIRVTTTGRPRLMQIEVKRLVATPVPGSRASAKNIADSDTSLSANPRVDRPSPVQSFTLNVSPGEQAALDQAAQAWRTCTPVLPGERKSFPFSIAPDSAAEVDFNSAGTVAGLRVRVPRDREGSVWMQVFWDGDTQPSMNAPLRALFGTAEQLLPYSAIPMGIVAEGTDVVFYNNFPMPFQSARFLFLNNSGEPLPLAVDMWLQETVPGTENARFYAYYGKRRVERREDRGDNYTIIDVNGSGKYLGVIFSGWDLDRQALNMALTQTWRFPYLESNIDVWIDGRLALPGTGVEDDFNASYYYVFTGYPGYNSKYCLAGVTLLDYDSITEPSSQYRFYLNDAPEFRNHLRVEAQHGNKGNNLTITYSSTAFWYQLK